MSRLNKRFKTIHEQIDFTKKYDLEEAVELLKKAPSVKFDQSVDLQLKMGVDPKKSDQQVRGTVSLPHGTGKDTSVLVFCKAEKVQEALDAGANFAGYEELVEKVKKGWTDFDAVIATPDLMREVGKLGKILGPRGLMPTPKAGTVTNDVAKATKELKAGKIEFKVDRHGVINNAVGKLSFDAKNVVENIKAFLSAIMRVRPASAKGNYMASLVISSTMGPGISIESKVISDM